MLCKSFLILGRNCLFATIPVSVSLSGERVWQRISTTVSELERTRLRGQLPHRDTLSSFAGGPHVCSHRQLKQGQTRGVSCLDAKQITVIYVTWDLSAFFPTFKIAVRCRLLNHACGQVLLVVKKISTQSIACYRPINSKLALCGTYSVAFFKRLAPGFRKEKERVREIAAFTCSQDAFAVH